MTATASQARGEGRIHRERTRGAAAREVRACRVSPVMSRSGRSAGRGAAGAATAGTRAIRRIPATGWGWRSHGWFGYMCRDPVPAGRVPDRSHRPGRPRGARPAPGHLRGLPGRAGLPAASLPALLRRPQVQAAAQSPGGDGPGLDDTARGGRDQGAALLGRLLRSETRRRRRHRWLLAAAVLLLAAVAGTGWGLRLAAPSAPATEAAGTILETLTIHGVTVLTDAEGHTLYWFGPDSATTTACVADCARSWPPLTGPAAAGTGVNGTIGAIVRPDGSRQATYDGHPLYTTTADTGPAARPGATACGPVAASGTRSPCRGPGRSAGRARSRVAPRQNRESEP